MYTVAGGKSLPEWLSEKKREALRKDEEFRRRIELIQELDFPCSSGRVKLSPDGQFLAVTGIHPPQARRPAAQSRPCVARDARASAPRRSRCTSCRSWPSSLSATCCRR